MTNEQSALEAARYFNLSTYRRNGAAVDTPVWFAGEGGLYYVFSAGEAGKVKRLRQSPRARVAACDLRGRLLGPWLEAEAVIVQDPEERQRALQALRAKYGWQMRFGDVMARLSGRFQRRAYLRVRLEA